MALNFIFDSTIVSRAMYLQFNAKANILATMLIRIREKMWQGPSALPDSRNDQLLSFNF